MTSNAAVPTKSAGEDPCEGQTPISDSSGNVPLPTYGGVIEDIADIGVLDVIIWVCGLHSVRVQLMEDKADSRSSRQLIDAEIGILSVYSCPEVRTKLGDDVQNDSSGVLVALSSAQTVELSLEFRELRGDFAFDIWKSVADVMHEDLYSWVSALCLKGKHRHLAYEIKLSSQEGCSAVLRFAPVRLVVLEKVLLVVQSICDRLLRVNVPLSSIDDRDVAQTKGNDTAGQDIDDIGTLVPAY